MVGYPIEGKIKAAGLALPISHKSGRIVCRKLRGMKIERAERFLAGLANETEDINKKHFNKTAKYILEVLKSAKNNAEVKGIEGELRIKVAVADRAPRRMRGKRRRDFGSEMKSTHIKIILEPLQVQQVQKKTAKEVETAIEEVAEKAELKAETMIKEEKKSDTKAKKTEKKTVKKKPVKQKTTKKEAKKAPAKKKAKSR